MQDFRKIVGCYYNNMEQGQDGFTIWSKENDHFGIVEDQDLANRQINAITYLISKGAYDVTFER